MAAGPGLVYDILTSVRYHLVMRRRHQIAILVVLVAATAVTGRTPSNGSANNARIERESRTAPTSDSSTMVMLKKSPRVFVNTSVPFSVAPQPVKDTREVALAKHTFMRTFRRIQDAVIAADTEHLNYTLLEDGLTNDLDEGTPETAPISAPSIQARTSFANRGPAPSVDFGPAVAFSIFPDPIMEPEYFLSSVHVDPLLMNQFDPPLPLNPFIEQIRPISDPGLVGTCYEIILLEPEEDFFHLPQGNASNGQGILTFPTHSSLLDAIVPSIQGRTRSNPKSSSASQIIPVGTPALPGASSRKPVPHFKAPQLSFLSLLQGGAPIPTGR